MADPGPSVLILSASIGEGHDLPARVLAEEIAHEDPTARVELVDALAAVGGLTERIATEGSRFHSAWGNRLFDAEYALVSRVSLTRRLAGALFFGPAARRLTPVILGATPDVVVSTYPGATEVLGRMRAAGRLRVPAVSAITDLSALRYWAHPAVDLHLITHPESAHEVREIAPKSAIECVRGLTGPEFYEPPNPAGWRRDRDIGPDGSLVAVSGGGWAVGDLAGATAAARAAGAGHVVVLGGRRDEIRGALETRFRDDERVRVLGFEERMSDMLAASEVLVHSTAGLTVLEAIMRGTRVISYGWGRGHIRANNAAFERYGLADVARTRAGLEEIIRARLADPAVPDDSFGSLPTAASEVLRLARPAPARPVPVRPR